MSSFHLLKDLVWLGVTGDSGTSAEPEPATACPLLPTQAPATLPAFSVRKS